MGLTLISKRSFSFSPVHLPQETLSRRLARLSRLNEASHPGKGTGVIGKAGNGRVGIKIIEPGQGATGFYTPEVLQATAEAGLFDNAPIMKNHPGTGQRTEKPDVDLVVGFIDPGTAHYNEKGSKGPGVYGTATILGPEREKVYSYIGSPFGLSIHADGELEREGDHTSRVLRIDKVHSVDLVVRPGAGGAITEVIESERFTPAPIPKIIDRMEENMGRFKLNESYVDGQGNRFVFQGGPDTDLAEGDDSIFEGEDGNLYRYLGNVNEGVNRAMEEDDEFQERGGVLMRRAPQALKANPKAKGPGFLKKHGKKVAAGAAVAGVGAGGYAAGKNKESEVDESEIFIDEEGNIFSPVGNLEEAEEEEVIVEARGAAVRSVGRAAAKPFQKSAAGRYARTKSARTATGQPFTTKQRKAAVAASYGVEGGLAAAGGGAGILAGKKVMGKKNEEAVDEEDQTIFEDEEGNLFRAVPIGNMDEEDGTNDEEEVTDEVDSVKEAQILAALGNIQEQLDMLKNGDAKKSQIMEAANISTRGSTQARRLIEEMVSQLANTPEEGKVLGQAIGEIIEADRESRSSGWENREFPNRWDSPAAGAMLENRQQATGPKDKEQAGTLGFWGSGGGNDSLSEDAGSRDNDPDKYYDSIINGVFA